MAGEIPTSRAASDAFELALREARAFGSDSIGTEHLLLGVALEGEGLGGRILVDLEADVEKLRNEVLRPSSGPSRRRRRHRRSREPSERFTERARLAVVHAQDEARALGHAAVGTEHLLLGLLRVRDGLAARVLEDRVALEPAREQVRRVVGPGEEETTGQIPFTPEARKVLELALRESLAMGHDFIGTEHVLLGLVRESEGVAARILLGFGVDAQELREDVLRPLGRPGPRRRAELERVRREKEEAIEAGEMERAAALRARERELSLRARPGSRVSLRVDAPAPGSPPRPRAAHAPSLLAGWLAFGVAFGIGLAVGRLIWG